MQCPLCTASPPSPISMYVLHSSGQGGALNCVTSQMPLLVFSVLGRYDAQRELDKDLAVNER